MDDWDAPPIKKPSISEIDENISMFFGLTDPPYKTIGNFFDLNRFLNSFFINLNIFFNSKIFGIFPVPIAQMGSYAIIILLKSYSLSIDVLICFVRIEIVLPFFFSLIVSPIQKIIFNFCLIADSIFF